MPISTAIPILEIILFLLAYISIALEMNLHYLDVSLIQLRVILQTLLVSTVQERISQVPIYNSMAMMCLDLHNAIPSYSVYQHLSIFLYYDHRTLH